MPDPPEPEILPPASGWRLLAERLFCNQNLDLLAHWLDDCFAVPGTNLRVGVDGIIGLIPGFGDVLAGLASSVLILAAWIRGVPRVALARMTINLGLGVLVGAIPFVGDAFDIAWKPNRRNYRLMMRHIRQPRRHTWKDYLFLAGLAAAVLVVLAAPLIVVLLLVLWLMHRL